MENIWKCHKMDTIGKTMNMFIAMNGKEETPTDAEEEHFVLN